MCRIEQQSNQKKSESEKDFVIILTVKGTSYEEVEIKITDPSKSIRQLIFEIVNALGLPKTDKGGNPVRYMLGSDAGDDEPKIMEFKDENGIEQSLFDYNIYSGCHLCLLTLHIAGGSSYIGQTYLPDLSRKQKEGIPLDRLKKDGVNIYFKE